MSDIEEQVQGMKDRINTAEGIVVEYTAAMENIATTLARTSEAVSSSMEQSASTAINQNKNIEALGKSVQVLSSLLQMNTARLNDLFDRVRALEGKPAQIRLLKRDEREPG